MFGKKAEFLDLDDVIKSANTLLSINPKTNNSAKNKNIEKIDEVNNIKLDDLNFNTTNIEKNKTILIKTYEGSDIPWLL